MQVALKGHLHAHVHLQVALKGHLQMLRVQFAFGKLHTLLHMHFAFGKMHVPQMHATFGGMHLVRMQVPPSVALACSQWACICLRQMHALGSQMHATFGGMHLLTSNKVSLFDVSMQVAL